MVKNLPANAEVIRDVGSISGSGRSPGSPTPAFLPGGLQSTGSQRVRHDQSDLACKHVVHCTYYHVFFSDAVFIIDNSGLCCTASE